MDGEQASRADRGAGDAQMSETTIALTRPPQSCPAWRGPPKGPPGNSGGRLGGDRGTLRSRKSSGPALRSPAHGKVESRGSPQRNGFEDTPGQVLLATHLIGDLIRKLNRNSHKRAWHKFSLWSNAGRQLHGRAAPAASSIPLRNRDAVQAGEDPVRRFPTPCSGRRRRARPRTGKSRFVA